MNVCRYRSSSHTSVQPQANVVDRILRKSVRVDVTCYDVAGILKWLIAIDPPTKLRMLESTDQSLKKRSRKVQRIMRGAVLQDKNELIRHKY